MTKKYFITAKVFELIGFVLAVFCLCTYSAAIMNSLGCGVFCDRLFSLCWLSSPAAVCLLPMIGIIWLITIVPTSFVMWFEIMVMTFLRVFAVLGGLFVGGALAVTAVGTWIKWNKENLT